MSGYLARDQRFSFGILPVPILEDPNLSTLARLCWAVLDSFGPTAFPGLDAIGRRMGLKPGNRRSVLRYLAELIETGYLTKATRPGRSSIYILTMPESVLGLGAVLRGVDGSPAVLTPGSQENGPAAKPGPSAADRKASNRHPKPENGGGVALELRGCSSRATWGVALEPHIKANLKAKLREGTETPPLALRSDDQSPPMGWEDWPDRVKARTGRGWTWDKGARAAARSINAALDPVTPALLDLLQGNFLDDAYWTAKGSPLHKLLINLNEFRPTAGQVAEKERGPLTTRLLPLAPPLPPIDEITDSLLNETGGDMLEAFKKKSKTL